MSWAELFAKLAYEKIQRADPEVRHARRQNKQAKSFSAPVSRRGIPCAVRDEALARAGSVMHSAQLALHR
jgi:hypothetical protein